MYQRLPKNTSISSGHYIIILNEISEILEKENQNLVDLDDNTFYQYNSSTFCLLHVYYLKIKYNKHNIQFNKFNKDNLLF